MNTQKIRILLTAIDCGSLTAAGERLGYTQSALTQMMKSFEDEVGFPLLSKSNRGVRPTAEAELLLPAMRRIVSSEEDFVQGVAQINGLHKGTVRIGSFVSTSIHWLPRVLEFFQENYPDIVFQITECGQDDMIKGLQNGSLDIALMSDPDTDTIDFIPVYEDPLLAVFSDKYDLSKYDYVPAEQLKKYPFVLESFDMDTDRFFLKAGFEPEVRYYSRDCIAILSMVKQGLGVAVLPELIVEIYPGNYEARMTDPEFYRTIGVGVRNLGECGPLTKMVIKYIRDNIR